VTIETPEEVTIHEIGHQWWYGLVGTNEFEHAWLDEGITTYAAARALTEAHPQTSLEHRYFGGFVPWAFGDIRLSRETYWNRLAGYRIGAKSDLPATPSYRYSPATGSYISYNKTALWLNTMERWLGWPVVQRTLATFFNRWKFKHPGPEDFFAVATEVAGRDLSSFFDQVHRTSNVFDYGVQALESTREGARHRTSVTVRRYGEAVFPVDVRVTFENGEQVTERWAGDDRWKLYTYERDSRAVSAQVDPDRVLLLDVNYTNNSRTLEPRSPQAATAWTSKWLVWLQDQLLTWAFFV
jgi:aminopeptidase N